MRKKNYENTIKLLISLLLFFCSGDVLKFILKLLNIDIKKLTLGNTMFIEFLLSLIITCTVVFLYFKYLKKDFIVFKKDLKKNIRDVVKLFFIFMLVKYLVGIVSSLIIVGLGYEMEATNSANQKTIEEFVKFSPFLMMFSSSILAPLYEETLFRLGFRKVISNKWVFVIVSGFLFGVLHIFPLAEGVDLLLGITQSISYVTMGIFLAYAYQKSNNIFTSIGVHFLNNFISVLVLINMG